MKASEGVSFEVAGSGHWKRIDVEIDDVDLVPLFKSWGVTLEDVAIHHVYLILTLHAQQLLAYRVFEAGGYTQNEYTILTSQTKDKLAKVRASVTGGK